LQSETMRERLRAALQRAAESGVLLDDAVAKLNL
jgi:hypothetical protein